jgi:hypothetical protein
MQQIAIPVLAGVLALAVSGCRPRQAAPAAATAPPALPDAVALSAQAHEFSGTDAVQLAASGATANVTGAYGIAVTVGTVAAARVTAPGLTALTGGTAPVRLAATSSVFARAVQSGIGTVRGMTSREALRDHAAMMQREIAKHGVPDPSPNAQKKPVLLDDARATAPQAAPTSQ